MSMLISSTLAPPVETRRAAPLPPPAVSPPSQRVVALDFLRGFVMFWLIGGRHLVVSVVEVFSPGWGAALWEQLNHPEWAGFTLWDMVMPVFLFLVGASLPFSIGKRLEQGGSYSAAYRRIFRRFIVLWIMGVFSQNFFDYDFPRLELFSNTLQGIAVGYAVTALALLHLNIKQQIVLCAGLLVGYWALLSFVPFGGYPAGTFEQKINLARWVDELVLGAHRRGNDYTWIVSSLGFAATVMIGAAAGHVLRAPFSINRKLLILIGAGAALVVGGWLWSHWLPLNRKLWTSSMVLWTGGWSCLLLAACYAIIDVAGHRRGTFFFAVIGANALLAYVIHQVYGRTVSDVLVENLASQWPEPYSELLLAGTQVAVMWLILWHLYRQRVFLRA